MAADPANPEPRIRGALDRLAGHLPAIGVAVSGGGDSTALMHMAAAWANGRRVRIATVDHGLRAESANEAKQVSRQASALGLQHDVLRWKRDGTESGNLMAAAREGRIRLLSDWARRNGLPAVALGHTADDQAETLYMRLSRGAGIDGLACMADSRQSNDTLWLRPMLGITRRQLRHWMKDRGISWSDDPSNEDEHFDRVRVRRAMTFLELDPQSVARSASHLAEARSALDHYALQAARQATVCHGSLYFPREALADLPSEIFRRLLIAGCRWVTGAAYPPRRQAVQNAIDAIATNSRATLDGVLIDPADDMLRLMREPAAALRSGECHGTVWDNRWMISDLQENEYIAALGFDALSDLPWRESGLSRDEAAASPAIWKTGAILAAPLLKEVGRIDLRPLRDANDLHRLLLSH